MVIPVTGVVTTATRGWSGLAVITAITRSVGGISVYAMAAVMAVDIKPA
jgi:hypothetical protein